MGTTLPIRGPLLGYARLKSAVYAAESLFSPLIEAMVTGRRPRLLTDDPELFKASRQALEDLLQRDIENIVNGVYPVEVLRPESPVRHLLRIPKMFSEGLKIARRRARRDAKEFDPAIRDILSDLPEYYRRNFHYQGDGYLSDRSARLYDHQVEVLFAGTADAMRRLILPPLRRHFGETDGRGLTFLELGAGTGSATRFVRMLFPKAHIVAIDLSGPYLKVAQERLRPHLRHDFVEAAAEALPFQDARFDAVFSVFLFHELPEETRRNVMREALRVAKGGGFIGAVDSLQLGDRPELESALEEFPRSFHEPFYANYIRKPLEFLFSSSGADDVQTDTGFFSKVVWGRRPVPGHEESTSHEATSKKQRPGQGATRKRAGKKGETV